MRNNLIAGLDIGTASIKVLVVSKEKDKENLKVLLQAQEPSAGVRRGVVIEVEKVSGIIRNLFEKARAESGQRIDSVYININGSHLFSISSRGTVAVSRADGRVSEEDVERVLQAAQTFSLPNNKEILEAFPKEFIIDGQGGVKEVVGMQGVRLETEVLAVGEFSPYKNNLKQAVLDADLQILDVIPSALSSAEAVLLPKQKELGVALLDIGAGTSNLAVFEEGNLIYLSVLPMGSSNITNDIAIGLKTDLDTAEAIKVKLGSCVLRGGKKKGHAKNQERIEVEGEEPLVFSRKTLNKIIEIRVSEILGEVRKELKKIGKYRLLPAGIVLTGGGAKLPGIVELVKKELKLPCRIGKPLNFSDLEEDPSFAAVCGLVSKGAEFGGGKGRSSQGFFSSGVKDKIKNFFKIFIP